MTEKGRKRESLITRLGKPKTSPEEFDKEAMKDPIFVEMKKRAEELRGKTGEEK